MNVMNYYIVAAAAIFLSAFAGLTFRDYMIDDKVDIAVSVKRLIVLLLLCPFWLLILILIPFVLLFSKLADMCNK